MIGVIAAAATCAALAPGVAAQDLDDPTTTTTTPDGAPGSTTTSTPSTPTTQPGDSTTSTVPATTTTIYVPPIPPELADDPRVPFLVDPGPGDGIDIPLAQLPFDPLSVTVMPERVEAAKAVLDTAQRSLAELQHRIEEHSGSVAELALRVAQLDDEVRDAVEAAARARKALRDHAVSAYMVGPVDEHLALLSSADALDIGVARSYLDVVAATRERLVREFRRRSAGLSDEHARLASELGERQSELESVAAQLPDSFTAVREASDQLAAYEAGAHAYIDGFVFPVAGSVEFIDSWGYPRMMGTSSAHWHQGTDIFAPAGTPLVASENGVLTRVGTASLGGNKLWVVGESGHHYYYAHLSAFAEGVEDGKRVRAGEVVGYVGDTGNARGTSPHLHFEIHPRGIGPANPYPLLKAAYGARPIARAVAPTTTTTIPPTAEPAGPPAAGTGG